MSYILLVWCYRCQNSYSGSFTLCDCESESQSQSEVSSVSTIVKPKQAGTSGRSIRNEHTLKSLICANIKYYRTYSIYLLSRLYTILLSITKKLHVNMNLALWLILRAPPTSASLFWFYYSSG